MVILAVNVFKGSILLVGAKAHAVEYFLSPDIGHSVGINFFRTEETSEM